ncbi:MAG TPA: hypothetical protein VGN20_02545 [Mucilaginibacter sp.]|jgi:hypothetical protein
MRQTCLFLIFGLFIAFAYPNNIPRIDKLRSRGIKQQVSLEINTFTELPEEIYGCSSFFYLSKNDRKLKKYIYVNDFGQFAFIKIGKTLEKFTLVKNYSIAGTRTLLYKKDSILLKIQIKTKESTSDGGDFVTGTMAIQNGNGRTVVLDFIGDIGC